MSQLPTGNNFHVSFVNDKFYNAHDKTFNFGNPEIRCLANAVVGQDGSNNPPMNGFPLSGNVKLSDMRGKPIPADGTLFYRVPGTYTLPIPIHTYIKVEVKGAGGGSGGWGHEDHGIALGTDLNIHIAPGGNGVVGQQSKFTCSYYGDLIGYPGTGGPGANPRSGPTVTPVNGTGFSTDGTATVINGGANNGGLCTAKPTLYWNNANYYSPLTSDRVCFGDMRTYELVCIWGGPGVGALCHTHGFYGGGYGGNGGYVAKTWQHDVTQYFLPWADTSGVVNATLVVGAGGAQGARGYQDTGDFDALGQGQPGNITVTFGSVDIPITPPTPTPPSPPGPAVATIQGNIICGSQSITGGTATGYAVNTYRNVGGATWINIGSVRVAYNNVSVQTSTFTFNTDAYMIRSILSTPDSPNVIVRISKQYGYATGFPTAITQMALSIIRYNPGGTIETFSSDFVNYAEYTSPSPNVEYSYIFSFDFGYTIPGNGELDYIFSVK